MKILIELDENKLQILWDALTLSPEDKLLVSQGRHSEVSMYAQRIIRAKMAVNFHQSEEWGRIAP